MPPNSTSPPPLLLNQPMRRGGPPVAGSSAPPAIKQSDFEDFANAYRPNFDIPLREPPPPKPVEEPKVDFGRSIKRLMKRPQGSPSVQSKNHRKEGIQRTPTVISGYPDSDRSLGRELKLQMDKTKPKRPVSASMDTNLTPPLPTFVQGPAFFVPLDSNMSKTVSGGSITPPVPSPTSKTPKVSIQQQPVPPPAKLAKPPAPLQPPVPPARTNKPQTSTQSPVPSPTSKTPKASTQQQPPVIPIPPTKTPKALIPQQQPPPPPSPVAKTPKQKSTKNGLEDSIIKMAPESANVLSVTVPTANPNQVKKKVPVEEERRRSETEGFSDAHCLIITGNNIGRFLPPRHNPDPILNLRRVPVQDRKYHVILEFEESSEPPKPQNSSSGMLVFTPEIVRDPREQTSFFSWIKESHVAPIGMLLGNVERITEFPYLTYLVVSGNKQELVQKLRFVGDRPNDRKNQLRFLAGYEEPVTICQPPLSTFPEKPASSKTGYVICLYQVLEHEDKQKFEQNWVMWTGARQIYRNLPEYMGLKRISVHKSIIPAKSINYVLICEFSNIMDHITDACSIIDHLRARCCGFIGIYRVLDAL